MYICITYIKYYISVERITCHCDTVDGTCGHEINQVAKDKSGNTWFTCES